LGHPVSDKMLSIPAARNASSWRASSQLPIAISRVIQLNVNIGPPQRLMQIGLFQEIAAIRRFDLDVQDVATAGDDERHLDPRGP